jgi:hypothetical protein
VLRDANAILGQSKSQFDSIVGFITLEAIRHANRDDLINAGLEAAQAAAVFTALGRYDARQSAGSGHGVPEPKPEPESEPELEPDPALEQEMDSEINGNPSHIDDRKSQQSCAKKLVLLVLCPVLALACALVSSLQALRYIDSFPWISRLFNLAQEPQPMDLNPPPIASNGHPCPWEL